MAEDDAARAPFEDVLRQLLRAKPQHKTAPKKKGATGKKNDK